jgi:hypothetical protein
MEKTDTIHGQHRSTLGGEKRLFIKAEFQNDSNEALLLLSISLPPRCHLKELSPVCYGRQSAPEKDVKRTQGCA